MYHCAAKDTHSAVIGLQFIFICSQFKPVVLTHWPPCLQTPTPMDFSPMDFSPYPPALGPQATPLPSFAEFGSRLGPAPAAAPSFFAFGQNSSNAGTGNPGLIPPQPSFDSVAAFGHGGGNAGTGASGQAGSGQRDVGGGLGGVGAAGAERQKAAGTAGGLGVAAGAEAASGPGGNMVQGGVFRREGRMLGWICCVMLCLSVFDVAAMLEY